MIQWVILGYALVITALMLGVARLGDMYHKKRLFGAGIIVFTVGSLLCGISPNIFWLIASRIIQGLGAVITQALGAAILVEVFPPRERGRVMGIIGGVVSVGIALGPALGGIIIGTIGWRWIFFINVPIGIVSSFILVRYVPSYEIKEIDQRFDLLGAFIMLLTLVCFALGMTMGQDMGFNTRSVQTIIFISGIGLISFILTENYKNQPMIELGLFRNSLFSLSLIMGLLTFISLGGLFLTPFYLELVKDYPMQQIGLMMMIVPLMMGIISPISGSLSDRFGTRGIVLIGLLIIFLGLSAMSTLTAETSVIGYLLRAAPIGIGLGIFNSPNNSAIMGSAPPHRIGVASGLLSLTRNLGQTLGMPFMGTLFTSVVLSSSNMPLLDNVVKAPIHALVTGFSRSFRAASIIIFISMILGALSYWREKKRNT
jgi:EmrB/QacA subfamily drug resistance transporter